MVIQHDNAPAINAVEDAVEFDIMENANFAFAEYMGHKNVLDVNSHADFWSWMQKGFIPLIFIQEQGVAENRNTTDPQISQFMTHIPRERRGIMLQYNRIVMGVRMRQERSEKEKKCTSMASLHDFFGAKCVEQFGYELDPEIFTARKT